MTQYQDDTTQVIKVNASYTYMYNSKSKTLYLSSKYDLEESFKTWVMQYGKDYNKERGGLEKLLNNL